MALVRLAESADIQALIEHNHRHQSESGRDGDLIFCPMEKSDLPEFEKIRDEKLKSWSLLPTECRWERQWIVEDEGFIRGEITLCHRPPMPATLHRAHLMMGLERTHRGGGWGTKLMQAALDWAHAQPTIDWVQLYVFDHNEPAKALYRKFGFEAVGTVEDLFRVFGQKISDTEMVLRLKR